jgi:predicted molibdopterin-dependent oxidoreductase YjgC
MAHVTLSIDGQILQAPAGSTILEAARAAGIRIPTLCYDPDLTPYGGCRLCIVKVEGMRGLPTSCTTIVAEGMKVVTEDEEILETRRTVLRLLMADHPNNCLNCNQNLDCEIQQLATDLGVREHGLVPIQRQATLDVSNPLFVRDMSRCVLCARCVRTCQEIVGLGAIDLVGRGHDSEPVPFMGGEIRASTCESCGECVAHCPTGALSFRNQPLTADLEVKTICPFCGVGCGLVLSVRRGEVIASRGDRDNPVNKGVLCVKGRFGSTEYINHPDRLTKPLVRKNGVLEETSWDEALDLVAERFKATKPREFGALSSAKVANEDNYLLQKLARVVVRSNNIDHCARL